MVLGLLEGEGGVQGSLGLGQRVGVAQEGGKFRAIWPQP
jgi:hypothetical protein